ncbi:LuxR C-terminal-related transcriptional regulator [Caproicibacter sp.]|uniref:helix-turn-helix transcriptional regulator n=1 Tax=Caproicibacter sp. TaxID=2814884 RepID=UPI00398A42B1
MIRKRLNSLLFSIDTYPLTIVEAPAGYGKTTAVKDYLSGRRNDVVWLSFQRMHGLSEIWSRFAEEMGKRDPLIGAKLAELGPPSDPPRREKAFSILNGLELKRPLVVVFDNYELAGGTGLAELLLCLGEEEINNLHLAVLTRDTSEFDLAFSVARERCYVISRAQLKFTADEVRDYCMLAQIRITDDAVDQLIAYADGWISLLYVMLAGMERGIPIGMTPTLDELIDQTLFQVHNENIRRYLLQLSVMDSFTARQADFVTDRQDSNELLRVLRKKNAFIQYDGQERLYRIHPVLLDFLRARQNFSSEEERALYGRLGEWLLRENDLRPAYSCLARAGKTERILSHMNRTLPIRNLYTDFDGADEVFESGSQELPTEYPVAYLRYLFFSMVSGKKSVVADLPRRLDRLEFVYRRKKGIGEAERDRVLAEILCVRKFTAFNRLEAMHAYNDEILRLLNGRQSSIMLQVNEFTFGLPHYLYLYFRDAGSLKSLAELSQYNFHPAFADGCGTGSDSLALAELACETGDFRTAVSESRKAVYKAETKAQLSIMICARFCGARANFALGQLQTARELLRTLREEAEQQSNPIYLSMARLCEGYLCAPLEMPIPQWLKDGHLSSLSLYFGGMGFDRLVYGKALLAQAEYLKLEALSDSFDASFAVFQNRLGFLHGAILKAAAKSHLSGAEAAVPELIRALDMAKPDGIVLPFAECARHLLPVFRALPKKAREDAFERRVQEICASYLEAVRPLLSEDRSLTAREIEVLQCLDRGLTRNEIADRLFISPGTVKTHLRAIYQKLDADGKVSALRAARQSGLL